MKAPFNFKLRGQLLLATGILVLIPLVVMGVLVNARVRASMTEQALLHNSHLGTFIASETASLIQQERENLAAFALAGDFSSPANLSATLARWQKQSGTWHRLYFADPTGHVSSAASLPPLPPNGDARSMDWYGRALTNPGGAWVSDPIYDDQSNQSILTFSTLVTDTGGEFLGVLGGDLSLSTLQTKLRKKIDAEPEMSVWLMDSNGNFILTPANQGGGLSQNLPLTPSEIKSKYLVAETHIPELNWSALVAQDMVQALRAGSELRHEIIFFTLIVVILATFGVLLYVNRLNKPIEELLTRVRAIEQGGCWRDLPPMETRYDEIGEVVQAFDSVTEELQELLRDVIKTLTTTLDARDPYTRNHSERVSVYAHLLAQHLGFANLESENVLRAGLLHDVGKIGIPGQILNKPGPLTEEEYEKMKSHSRASYDILQGIPFYLKLGVADMVLEHHEHWDGSGYPHGLKGTRILPGARVLAIADAFDAITSDRAYRKALSLDEALAEIKRGAGTHFDPEMVKAFMNIPREELLAFMDSSLSAHMERIPLISV